MLRLFFDYSEKEHKGLVPQAAQISQKHICLKIRNDWRVQGNGSMMGRFILQLAGRQAGHGPTSSRSQARGREHVLSDMGADSMLAAVDTNVTAVTQVTASPLLPQDLHSASPL